MMDRTRTRVAGPMLVAAALLAGAPPVAAQHEAPPPPAAYALEDVTVFHADGRRDAGVNVVVRRGLIVAMGPGIEIPADAQVLEGDSLMVYPGLVDAHGEASLDLPEVEGLQSVLPWDPPRDAQGFTPHRQAAFFLTGSGPEGRDARIDGVIAAGVHPGGGIAPGQSAAVIFRKGAKTPWETVARPSAGLSFTFQGARGAYPSTLFGVMALFRQAFEDAGREGLIDSEYRRDPRGLLQPRWDPDYEVLRRAASGDLPVFFSANSAGDIRRVLSLADELGFRVVLVGGEQGWKVAEELRARSIPVLVSVDYPAPTEWKPGAHSGEGTDVEAAEGMGAAEVQLEPGAAKEKERLENAYTNPARLMEAGISVALTSGGSGRNLREGVAKAIEYGLSEADALSAVTTIPASILGIPHVATVTPGMGASFIVTDGPLFGEGTTIRYTFVEGELERGRAGPVAGGEVPSVDVSGEWDLVVSAAGMDLPSTLTLVQEGAAFSGTISSAEMGEVQIQAGTVSGNQITFTLVVSMGTESMEAQARGSVEGERISGSGSSPMGEFTFIATRKPGMEGGLR